MNYADYIKPYIDGFRAVDVELDGFKKAIELAKGVRSCAGRVFFIGNGGSAAIASHMAIDWMNKAEIPAMAFNDSAALTCLSNDYGFESVFSRPMIMHDFGSDDLLFAISSSGKSRNILKAVERADEATGKVITLTGFDPDNPLRKLGNVNFYVPSHNYGVVETVHLGILHTLLEALC